MERRARSNMTMRSSRRGRGISHRRTQHRLPARARHQRSRRGEPRAIRRTRARRRATRRAASPSRDRLRIARRHRVGRRRALPSVEDTAHLLRSAPSSTKHSTLSKRRLETNGSRIVSRRGSHSRATDLMRKESRGGHSSPAETRHRLPVVKGESRPSHPAVTAMDPERGRTRRIPRRPSASSTRPKRVAGMEMPANSSMLDSGVKDARRLQVRPRVRSKRRAHQVSFKEPFTFIPLKE